LVLYAVLGIAAAIVSVIFTEALLKVRLWFRGLRIVPVWMQPGIGGLVTGVLAVVMLRFFGSSGVTGGGYETLGQALGGKLGLEVLMLLCIVKLIATVCSYSSGGAGGIFAPALFVGAMLGGTVGHLDVILLGHEHQQLGAFALVGMGAVFAGVIRAPITSVLIIFEMTGGYGLVLPLMLANMTAYILARRWRPTPIYEAFLEQDGVLLPHTASPRAHPLEQLLVSEAMTADVVTASIQDTVAAARTRIKGQRFSCLPVTDGERLAGVVPVVSLDGVDLDPGSSIRALFEPPRVVSADTPLLRAVVRMNDLDVRHLMVVDPKLRSKLLGVLTMSDAMRAHARVAVSRSSGQFSTSSVRSRELVAAAIMEPAIVVNGGAKLAELMVQLKEGTPALIVATHAEYSIVLAEQLRDLIADEHLAKMLIAADVGQPSPSVDARTPLAGVTRVLRHEGSEAIVVLDGETHEPVGVITKSVLGRALLDHLGT
jgi:CIC family chloride channel protein